MSGCGGEEMDGNDITDFQYALLGLLAFRPMSGYDVKRAFAGSPLGRYSSSSGAIYPALVRLEKLGLVSASVEREHELRPRKVYVPAPAGLRALDAWLGRLVDRTLIERDMSQVLLRFALMEARLDRDQVIAFLESVAAGLQGYLADLESYSVAAQASFLRHRRLAMQFGLDSVRTQLDWACAALVEMRSAV
jgi:PadR family transcriptional regulator, regulatory protein AphA